MWTPRKRPILETAWPASPAAATHAATAPTQSAQRGSGSSNSGSNSNSGAGPSSWRLRMRFLVLACVAAALTTTVALAAWQQTRSGGGSRSGGSATLVSLFEASQAAEAAVPPTRVERRFVTQPEAAALKMPSTGDAVARLFAGATAAGVAPYATAAAAPAAAAVSTLTPVAQPCPATSQSSAAATTAAAAAAATETAPSTPAPLPYPLWWMGPYSSGSGYGSEAINFVLSLLRSGRVRADDVWLSNHGG
jgi:hypothetical protein